MADRTFDELWKIAYIEYLKLRRSFNIQLDEEQKQILAKEGIHVNGKKNGAK